MPPIPLQNGELRRDPLGMLAKSAELGPLVRVSLGARSAIVASSAETVHALVVEHADAFQKTDAFHGATSLLGSGLPLLEGSRHKRRRRLMAPAFGHGRIAAYTASMIELTERAQARWRDGERVDLADQILQLNLAIVAKTLLGADLAREAAEIDRALKAIDAFVAGRLGARVALPLWLPTRANLGVRRAIARLDRTIFSMLAARRSRSGDTGDLLSQLFGATDEDGQRLDDDALRDEALSLLLACQDTTPNALAWAIYLLITHPEAYAALRREADAALGGRSATAADTGKLGYALQVFRETLRLYPPVYMTSRQALRDVEIGGERIAAGELVFANIYGLHRRADVFEEPERFRPERWAGDFDRRLPRGSYLPFIDGPRVCIGNHFALLEGQIVLATLAQRVELELEPGRAIEADPVITLRPRGGLPVTVRRRQPAPS